jgi:hypothetical protein
MRLKAPQDFNHLLRWAEKYMQSEEIFEANNVMNVNKDLIDPQRLMGQITMSIPPLNMSRDRILQKCINVEFKEESVEHPHKTRKLPGMYKSGYFCFHYFYGHIKEERIELNVAIEDLILKGKLKRFEARNDWGAHSFYTQTHTLVSSGRINSKRKYEE